MGRLLRRLVPLAAVFAWRNRDQISDWYRKRSGSNDDTEADVPKTQIAPIPAGDAGAANDAGPAPTPATGSPTATT